MSHTQSRFRKKIATGIRSRIFLLVFAVLIPLLLAQTHTYYSRFQAQRAQELQANLEIARAVEQTFGTFLKDVVHQEMAIGIGITLARPSSGQIALILDEINSEYPAIRDFSWMTPSGRIVASSDRQLIGTDHEAESFLAQIRGGEDWVVGHLTPSLQGRPVFTISRGIRDRAEVLQGIVSATVIPEELNMMSTIERAGQGGIIIIDDRGTAVYSHPNVDWTWDSRRLIQSYPELLSPMNNKETTATVTIGGKEWMASLTPILDSPGWIAGAGRPKEEVMAPLIAGVFQQMAWFLVVLAVSVLLALSVSRTITVPVRRLRDHVSKVGRGELSHRLTTEGPAELKELAKVFNQMAEKIRARETALRRAHDKLEDRVRRRTVKLAETNTALQTEIAERKRAEESLKIYTEKLEWSNRELQDFAFVASHDLQEPLRKIQAFGDLLKEKSRTALDDEQRDYLERMQNAARRMQELIHALLTYSRVTTRGQPFVPVDLNDAVRKALSNLEVLVEETGAQVEVEELPTIDADPSQMMQLFQNLIGNAVKFHRKAELPRIVVSSEIIESRPPDCSEGSPCEEFCVISVKDNGIGFDPAQLDRIFAPFQRLHGRSEYDGTGIGLAICRKIAQRHRGKITAESTPGLGSRFIVSLPARHSEMEESEDPTCERPVEEGRRISAGRRRSVF